MTKKSGLKFKFDSPVILTFVLIKLFVFLLDKFLLKDFLSTNIFVCHGCKASGTIPAFDFKNAIDYVRMFLYVFGTFDFSSLILQLLLILLLGPLMEERYGSAMICLMLVICTLVSGVLFCCLNSEAISTSVPVVFTLILLSAMTAFSKKEISVSWILIFVLYVIFIFAQKYVSSVKSPLDLTFAKKCVLFFEKNTENLICLVGGICGSLFGFLTSPKKRASSKKSYDDEFIDDNKKGFWFKKKEKKQKPLNEDKTVVADSDETIIGSVDF